MNKKFRFVSFVVYALCLAGIFCNRFTNFKTLGWNTYEILGILTIIICLTSANKKIIEPNNRIQNRRPIETLIIFLGLLVEVLIVILIDKILTSFYYTIILQNIVPLQALPVNQETLNTQKEAYPLRFYLSTLVAAPIMEESVFRYLPKNFITNKKVFIIVSSLLFAMPHVIDTPNWILYLPLYIIPAVYLGYKYWETDNILLNMFIHFMFNFV